MRASSCPRLSPWLFLRVSVGPSWGIRYPHWKSGSGISQSGLSFIPQTLSVSDTRAGQELTGVCHHGRAGFRLLGSTRETCSTQYCQLTPKLSGKMSLSPYLSLVLCPLAVPSPHWYIYGPAFQDAFCVFIPGFNISHPL